MATLVSPGVSVDIIDESFYGTAGAGTVPLIIMATASNKVSPSGTGTAPYTLPAQAGNLFLATSQRELIQNFGNPIFKENQGTPVHGHELNEYGLHAAYSYLGISNRCYVVRADIDLSQLEARASEPTGPAIAGTYWLDLGPNETRWGVFQSIEQSLPANSWEPQNVIVIDETNSREVGGVTVPVQEVGVDGDFAVTTVNNDNRFYEKISGTWYLINSSAWKIARPTVVRGTASPGDIPVGVFAINGQEIDFNFDLVGNQNPPTITLIDVIQKINAENIPNILAEVQNGSLAIRNVIGEEITLQNVSGMTLETLGLRNETRKGNDVIRTNGIQYPAGSVMGDVWIKGSPTNNGASWKFRRFDAASLQWIDMPAPFYPFDSSLEDGNPSKDEAAMDAMGVVADGSLYIGYDNATGVQVPRIFLGGEWEDLSYESGADEPSTPPNDGTFWYNTDFRVDIMYGDGDTWIGYRRQYPDTDPGGVFLTGTAPVRRTAPRANGSWELADNDLWIDTTDTENYPALHRYDASSRRWKLVDLTDQTSPFGIVFADARQDSGPAFANMPNAGEYAYNSTRKEDMLVSDYLEPDAPDPRLYPAGTLLFNTRYSTYNVKEWRANHFEAGGIDPEVDFTQESYGVGDPSYVFPPIVTTNPGRWVTASGNRLDGSPYMGRKAVRQMIVRAMQETIQLNDDLRSELVYFNLIAAPGYPELIDEMVTLNVDQKETSFIVGDTPLRLKPKGQDIVNWAGNANGAGSNGEDGLTSSNIYTGIYYPWGLGTNIDGSEIVIPPSTIALRVMAYNDQLAYPWFAPAGFQRGLVTNATTVGYLTEEDEFKAVLLNPGQRDVLYLNRINPIAFIPGRGLVVYGQKTLSPLASALDRVNVARLANYLKFNLDNVMKPFLFEQNDQQTRDAARITVERFLNNLVGLRALDDYAVVCSTENNTPERIDRNELWVDILIRPIKVVEFIYIPVRIRNTGDDLNLNT